VTERASRYRPRAAERSPLERLLAAG